MSQGKFSQPRPHRDEERQIEQAFRQVKAQDSATQKVTPLLSEEQKLERTVQLTQEQIDQALREAQQQNAAQIPTQKPPAAARQTAPKKETFDLLPEDMDAFFEGSVPMPEVGPDDSDPDFVDKMLTFFNKAVEYCKKNQKFVMAGACAGALLLIVLFIVLFFVGSSGSSDTILDNVYLGNIPVGGMTKNEAISTVKEATSTTYGNQDMVIDLSGTELRLTADDTDVELDIKAAVNAAYDYGRTGTKSEQKQAQEDSKTEDHIIALLPYLELNTDFIKGTLTSYAEDTGSTLTQPTYGLEGDEPELSADKFDKNAPTQTLVITMGTPGVGFDANDVYNQVLDAYSLHTFLVEVENVDELKEPDEVDLDAIYEEFYIEPVNASVNMQTFKTESGSYGYGFDLQEARKLIEEADYGEEVRIPMEYIEPDILSDDSFFKDTLGEYKTRTTGNSDRNKNLELACKAVDDTILNPGETLSFSTALGKVSGFRTAPEDTGREDISQGGVSQVSSTLYYAALLSDLEIVSRSNHGYVPSFIEYGLDATSSLKIKNSSGYPIRIEAEVSGGYVKVSILGTEERDYYISLGYTISTSYQPETEYEDYAYDNEEGYKDGDVIEEGTTGYLVKTYKVKYDNKTGSKLTSDFLTNSTYPAVNRVIARVEPEPTTEPTTEATEPPTETTKPTEASKPTETTVPPTTEATEPTTQPTTAPTSEPTTAPSSEATSEPTTEPVTPSTEAKQEVISNDAPVESSEPDGE